MGMAVTFLWHWENDGRNVIILLVWKWMEMYSGVGEGTLNGEIEYGK
jgi:hypothetical protein